MARGPLQRHWRMQVVQALPQQEACYIRVRVRTQASTAE